MILKTTTGKNLLLGFISLSVSYCLLVMGDWYFNRLIVTETDELMVSNAREIEALREVSEDESQKKLAIEDGFLTIVYPALFGQVKLEYPLIAGIPDTDTYDCNEGYGLVRYRSDRFGFRNNDEDWDKPINSIVIGDSFVHGSCVHADQTLSKNIERNIGETVLSLGIGGNSPSEYLAYGELFIPKVKPSNVILVFGSNDNNTRATSDLERVYVDEGRKLFSSEKLELFDVTFFKDEGKKALVTLAGAADRNNRNYSASLVNYKIKNAFLRHASLPSISELIASQTHGFSKTEETIRRISKLCKDYECDLTIAYIPNSNFYRPDLRANQYGDNIADLSSALGLTFFDGRSAIDLSEGSEDYAPKGPHLSPIGYQKIANLITSQTGR